MAMQPYGGPASQLTALDREHLEAVQSTICRVTARMISLENQLKMMEETQRQTLTLMKAIIPNASKNLTTAVGVGVVPDKGAGGTAAEEGNAAATATTSANQNHSGSDVAKPVSPAGSYNAEVNGRENNSGDAALNSREKVEKEV